MELFEDFTVNNLDHKHYVMIQKREYNPKLSYFQNMVLDLVDFKDRVRPLQRDVALMEKTSNFQKQNVDQMLEEKKHFQQMLGKIDRDRLGQYRSTSEEGYSSGELPQPKEKIDE